MSDEQMPAWAKAMEERLTTHLFEQETRAEHRQGVQLEAVEHRLVLEISQAIATSEDRTAARIADLRAEMDRRFDQVHDDLTVNLARADLAVERVQRLEGDVRKELSLLQRRLRELESWRDRHPEVGP